MTYVRRSFAAAGILIALTVVTPLGQQPPASTATALRSYRSVTAEQLKHPDAADWLMAK